MSQAPAESQNAKPGKRKTLAWLASLGFVASCLGVGLSFVLSQIAMPYYVAYYGGKTLFAGTWCGLILSSLAIGVGEFAGLKHRDAPRLFTLAWLGFGIPMIALIYRYALGGRLLLDWR